MTSKFKIGDLICKPKGYAFDGVVVAVFTTMAMEVRVVAEMQTENGAGMLHIFSEAQLEKRVQAVVTPRMNGTLRHVLDENGQLRKVVGELAAGLRNHIWPTATNSVADFNKATDALKTYNSLPHVIARNSPKTE